MACCPPFRLLVFSQLAFYAVGSSISLLGGKDLFARDKNASGWAVGTAGLVQLTEVLQVKHYNLTRIDGYFRVVFVFNVQPLSG